MATNRFQFSDDFVLKNGRVGINSADPQAELDVRGTIKADNLTVTGFATFTSYEGFLRSDYNIDESLTITNGSALSGELIVGTGVTVTNNAIDYAGQGQIDSLKVYNTLTIPRGGTEERPTKAKPGQLYYNKDFSTIEFYTGEVWRQVDNTTRSGRGVFGGGLNNNTPAYATTNIQYLNINSPGNAQNFGDLTQARRWISSFSSSTRGIFSHGEHPSTSNRNDYVTIASQGNAIDFGLGSPTNYGSSSCSSSTRGITGGGASNKETISYVEISTLGGAQDFGDLSIPVTYSSSSSSSTRGIFAGGRDLGNILTDNIQFITISSLGDSTDFGNLTHTRAAPTSFSSGIRSLICGGGISQSANWNVIDYITIASTGNAVDFGDLTVGRWASASASTSITGVILGGTADAGATSCVNVIDYVKISSTGNAQDFGDSVQTIFTTSGCSDSHGGLGGF